MIHCELQKSTDNKEDDMKCRMKPMVSGFMALCASVQVYCQNPIVPPGLFIADPEAHVWSDGRIYVYGSRDESNDYWCSYSHHVLSSNDLKNWTIVENAFASKGANDQVPYCDHLLFAPDCAYKNGIYYLYFCSPDKQLYTEGVATSSSPLGPFKNGKHMVGANEIDPAVLVDTDGQGYFLWGQGKPKMAKLSADMLSIDKSTLTFPLDSAGNEAFHEGSSIRKIGDWYYLVFADDSRNHKPTCLGYAMSKNPMGPYTYKGVIIDNIGADPAVWNNHGSIEMFDGQCYVFYHRSSHNSQKFRKACIEPVTIAKDGTIAEIEMTTQGALGHPIAANEVMDAARACLLSGSVFISDLAEADVLSEGLTNISDGDFAVFKYLMFDGREASFRVKTSFSKGGVIEIRLDRPDGIKIGECRLPGFVPEMPFAITDCKIKRTIGKHAVYLVFRGDIGSQCFVDWYNFGR